MVHQSTRLGKWHRDVGEKLVIVIMSTDDLLIACSKNAKAFIDHFERTLNEIFEATPCEETEYYMSMHIARDRNRGLLGFDARWHVYNYIWHTGRDPASGTGVSTPLMAMLMTACGF
jgi:hypothetical protein